MRFSSTLAALALAAPALARGSHYLRKIDSLLGDLGYIETPKTIAFTFWIQLVSDKLGNQLNNVFKGKETYTILMPETQAWDEYLTSLGGNTTEIESFSQQKWRDLFTDLYPYLFLKGALNTTAVEAGETVVLDSIKQSPVGDWPLSIAFRWESAYEPGVDENGNFTSAVYNGTVYNEPWGAANITIPDNAVRGQVAQVINYMPTMPKNLGATITDLGVEGWSELTSRVSSAAALETSRNYTLLLPPSSAISTALAGSDAELSSFVDAHLIPSRLVLSSREQSFQLASSSSGTATGQSIVVNGVNATVVTRDVLTNGIVVHAIDRSLYNSTSSSNSSVQHREL
ncbi:hypothetical protein JCM10207_002428 [Rhodosporidiobolus poonsookiae]